MKKVLCISLAILSSNSFADSDEMFQRFALIDTQLTRLINNENILKDKVAILESKINKKPHAIGDLYRGGIVFYVDDKGQHGLIVSKIDSSEGIQWRNGSAGNKVTNARGDGVRAGEGNTHLIISQQTIDNQRGSFAASNALNFRILADGLSPCPIPTYSELTCFGGWYLPSVYELQLMYKNLNQNSSNFFSTTTYWSSTEASVNEAWTVSFATGEVSKTSKSSTNPRVRAISRF